jgi:hypothetical protein
MWLLQFPVGRYDRYPDEPTNLRDDLAQAEILNRIALTPFTIPERVSEEYFLLSFPDINTWHRNCRSHEGRTDNL